MFQRSASPRHPYYPPGLQLPGYHPPLLPFEQTLAVFFGGCALVFILVLLLIGMYNKVIQQQRRVPWADHQIMFSHQHRQAQINNKSGENVMLLVCSYRHHPFHH